LGDDVEIAPRVQLNVDVRERLQPRPELAPGTTHSLGHRADHAVLAGEQSHDPVGLAELVLAQHHRSIPVQPHRDSVSPRGDIDRTATPDILKPSMALTPKTPVRMTPAPRFPTLTQLQYR